MIKNLLSHIISICYLFLWLIKLIINENFTNYILKKHQKRPLIILGNGPSLSNIINKPNFAETRNNYHFCTVNFSVLSPFFYKIKPEYLTIADPLFFERPITNKNIEQFIKELHKINWDVSLIVPFKYFKQIKEELTGNSFIKITPIHTNILNKRIKYKFIRNYIYKMGLSCPRVQNVVVASIYSMINYGYNKIYLYGVDHSWTTQLCVNKNNQVCARDIHFDDKEEVELKPYLKHTGEEYKMHEILRDFAHMFESYHELQRYAEYLKDVRIINRTQESFIDAFIKE